MGGLPSRNPKCQALYNRTQNLISEKSRTFPTSLGKVNNQKLVQDCEIISIFSHFCLTHSSSWGYQCICSKFQRWKNFTNPEKATMSGRNFVMTDQILQIFIHLVQWSIPKPPKHKSDSQRNSSVFSHRSRRQGKKTVSFREKKKTSIADTLLQLLSTEVLS